MVGIGSGRVWCGNILLSARSFWHNHSKYSWGLPSRETPVISRVQRCYEVIIIKVVFVLDLGRGPSWRHGRSVHAHQVLTALINYLCISMP
jgi:hypothetical protein